MVKMVENDVACGECPTSYAMMPLTILLSAIPLYVLSSWATFIYDRIVGQRDLEEEKLKQVYNPDTCAICLDSIIMPAGLQCGHVHCLACLETYIVMNRGILRCTLCRELITDVYSIKSSLRDIRANIKIQQINLLVHQINHEMKKV